MTNPSKIILPLVRVKKLWTDDWGIIHHLRPIQAVWSAAPSISAATLDWRYGKILRPGSSEFENVFPDPLVESLLGWFIQIVMPSEEDPAAFSILWTGKITGSADQIGSTDSAPDTGTGQIVYTALGLERLLYDCPLRNFPCLGTGSEFVWSDMPIPFNVFREADQKLLQTITGNRSAAKEDGAYVFSPAEGEKWSIRDVIEHLLKFCGPTDVPFSLYDNAVLQKNLDDHTRPASWHLADSLGKALDTLVDRRRGHTWRVSCYGANPLIEIQSVFGDDEAAGLEPNGVQIDLVANRTNRQIRELSVRASLDSRYDRIEVLGESTWVCGSALGDNLIKFWSDDLQTAYDAADDAERKTDKFRHVYCTWTLDAETPFFAPPPGIRYPEILPGEQGDVFFTEAGLEAGYVPQLAPFTRTLPLLEGYDYSSGSPVKTDSAGSGQPIPAAAFILFEGKWEHVDRAETGGSVAVLSQSPGIHLAMDYNHRLAKDTFAGDSDLTPTLDWRMDLAVTVAMKWPLLPQVRRTLTDSANPRTLVIRIPDAELWILLAGTIYHIADDGTLCRLESGMVVRNDTPLLAQIAELAAAWYGRPRRALELAYSGTVADFAPGDLVKHVLFDDHALEVNSVITRIVWDWSHVITKIETDFGELDFASMGRMRI
jgi:hypothetical protein